MTARSNGAARGVTRSEETWASPPTESPGKVLSPRIARARAGDREACDETTRGTRPETRTRAPVRQAGVRARRDVWPMRARAEVLRQLACRLPICDKKLRFLPVRVSTPRFTPEYFFVFFTHGQTVCEYQVRVLVTSSHARSGRRTLFRGRVLFPPGASLVSDLVARERGDFPEAGGCLARASLGSARATARIPRSRLAECSFSLPETGGPPRSPHLSLRRTRAACASEQRNGGRLRRQSGATPSDRARSLDLTLASRRARHLAHATRVEDAPTQFARRTALLVAPTFRHRRRWKNFARARRRGREAKEIIADEPGQNHG